jgi:predicted DCC family thiol-disulfide oxidoreductase YuxK
MNKESTSRIILFDGVCNLCNSAVNFVIERDRANLFKFTTLQEEPGISLLKKYRINSKEIDSIVLIAHGKVYVKSTAALRIAKNMSKGWPLLYIFIIVPVSIRDKIYEYVARKRYTWFGKKEQCMIPSPSLKEKFL